MGEIIAHPPTIGIGSILKLVRDHDLHKAGAAGLVINIVGAGQRAKYWVLMRARSWTVWCDATELRELFDVPLQARDEFLAQIGPLTDVARLLEADIDGELERALAKANQLVSGG